VKRKTDASDGKSRHAGTELTEAEWAVMRVVWEHEPCAAGTVQEALEATRKWAYSTVKTIMDRMVKKGYLTMESIRNLQLFRSTLSESEARRREIAQMLRRAFDGAVAPMVHFLLEDKQLSRDELDALRSMVDEAERSDQ